MYRFQRLIDLDLFCHFRTLLHSDISKERFNPGYGVWLYDEMGDKFVSTFNGRGFDIYEINTLSYTRKKINK